MKLLVQNITVGSQTITGPLKNISTVGDIISRVLLFLFPAAGLVLLVVLIWGGFDFIQSEGNPEKVKSAWAKITAGIVGFILLVLSMLFVRLIAVIFGLDTGTL